MLNVGAQPFAQIVMSSGVSPYAMTGGKRPKYIIADAVRSPERERDRQGVS